MKEFYNLDARSQFYKTFWGYIVWPLQYCKLLSLADGNGQAKDGVNLLQI
jgi:hypothetical protein